MNTKIIGWHIRVKNAWLGLTLTDSGELVQTWTQTRDAAYLYEDFNRATRVFQTQCETTTYFGMLDIQPGDLALEAVWQPM
jgi:hypothetical protein